MEELRNRVARNPVVKAIIPLERDILSKLNGSSYELEPILRILWRELDNFSYTTTVMNLIIEAVETESKSDLDFLARELVTSLENQGMSRAHIYFSNKKFFFDKKDKIKDSSSLRDFFEIIFPHLHEFTVGLKISSFGNLLHHQHFAAFGLELSEDIRDQFENFDPTDAFFNLLEEQVFLVCTDIKAHDRFSAVNEAVQKAGLLKNLFRFYHHAETFSIEDKVMVSQCCTEEIALCSRDSNRMYNVEDERPSKAGKRLKTLLRDTRLIRGEDASRFISLAEFHGMGLDTSSVENQIINLWISLETIAPSHSNRSKIDNVVSALLPVTGVNYASRLLGRLSVDLFTWSRYRTSRCLREVEPTIRGPLGKILAVLTLPEYNEKLKEIFAALEDFELLRYRLFRMYEVFSNPQKLLSMIEDHQERVDWQIRRIYRARNSIVHLGRKPTYAANLVDNAHDYLDQAISTSVQMSMGANGFVTYKECFDFLSWEFDVYKKRLKDMTEFDRASARYALWERKPVYGRSEILIK